MNLLYEVRKQMRAKLVQRRRVLDEQLRNSTADTLDNKYLEETTGIRLVNEMLDHDVTSEGARRRHVTITTSEQEAWYRETMATWVAHHPESGVEAKSNAGLYRLAMKFFVEAVVLSPRNTMVSYNDLKSQMERLNDIDPVLASLTLQLRDMRELLSFNTAITHMESTRPMTPERDLGHGVLSREIHSEVEDDAAFSRDFDLYRKQRKASIAKKRKRQSNEGLEFNHD
ncbi:hypothetical protein ACHWP0_07665 [Weissella cibaria]|uniref:hypothetical protein n=1 Tax=Weissella cibaria TaxID=137591 RepID=UPI00376F1395